LSPVDRRALHGVSSGLPLALSAGTLQVWQARAGVDLTTIGFFVLVGVVYSLKFVWAPFMDRIPLPGPLGRLGRRRGWAILTQLGLMVTIVMLGASDPVTATGRDRHRRRAGCFQLGQPGHRHRRVPHRSARRSPARRGRRHDSDRLSVRHDASGAGALFLHNDGNGLSWFGVYVVMAALVLIGIAAV